MGMGLTLAWMMVCLSYIDAGRLGLLPAGLTGVRCQMPPIPPSFS